MSVQRLQGGLFQSMRTLYGGSGGRGLRLIIMERKPHIN